MSRFARARDDAQRATTLELFYDLVFVFAITQVSHLLVDEVTWTHAGQAAIVLLVVWWSWNYTTWVTNELDPESPVVRLLMIALMLASLTMAAAIPDAFGEEAALFVGSYLAIQVGRHMFLTFVAADGGTLERERAGRILAWFAAAGVFWVAGAVADGSARTALWLVALAIDYGAPLALFWIPGRTFIGEAAWQVSTAHFSERFGLFVIIALGESIVALGTGVHGELDAQVLTAVVLGLIVACALWWAYFDVVAVVSERRFRRMAPELRVRIARDSYSYLHLPMIAGIVLVALGVKKTIGHVDERLEIVPAAALFGGISLYYAGHVGFRLRNLGTINRGRTVALVASLVLIAVTREFDALLVLACAAALTASVIAYEATHFREARRRIRQEQGSM